MIREIMAHIISMTRIKRFSLVTTVASLDIVELTIGRRRSIMRRSRAIRIILKATLLEMVHIIFLYALNHYLLTLFQIVGLSILVLHLILLEIINLLLPCKQFQREIDLPF
jgi:hypothetical protein